MNVLAFSRPAPQVASSAQLRLGMMHLAPQGLSEQWLLRESGDRHWSLIAAAMGQDRAVFSDTEGRAIYAAFCATLLTLKPVQTGWLGEEVQIQSELYRVSASQLGSIHSLSIAGREVAELLMISTFVGHDTSGSNHKILRRQPQVQISLPDAPEALMALADRARQQARQTHDIPDLSEAQVIIPCPALDFNAVGLLYFPSFSRFAEQADWVATGGDAPLACREVIYLGNLNRGESLALHVKGERVSICRSSGKVICRIHTLRQQVTV
jgi:probable biosynthetic protein (TIGR04099 family)